MPEQTTEVPEAAIHAVAESRYLREECTAGDWADVGGERRERKLEAARLDLQEALPILTASLREELEEAKALRDERNAAADEFATELANIRALIGSPHWESALQSVRGLKDLREAALTQHREQVERADSAERRLAEATKAITELVDLRDWLRRHAGRPPDERADAYRIAAGSSLWNHAERFLATLQDSQVEDDETAHDEKYGTGGADPRPMQPTPEQVDGEGEKRAEGPEVRYGACGVPGCTDCKPKFVEAPGAPSISTARGAGRLSTLAELRDRGLLVDETAPTEEGWPNVFAHFGRSGAIRDSFPTFSERRPGTNDPVEEYVPKSLYEHIAAEAIGLSEECGEWKRTAEEAEAFKQKLVSKDDYKIAIAERDSRLTKESVREKLLYGDGEAIRAAARFLDRAYDRHQSTLEQIAGETLEAALDAAFGDDR